MTKKRYTFVVAGKGVFPRDMLHYEHAIAFSLTDQAIIDAALESPLLRVNNVLRLNRVKLITPYPTLTPERWRSFSWRIVEGVRPASET